MWLLLIATLLIMSALTIYQTPREWFKRPILRIFLLTYHVIGIASILLLLWAVYRMPDGFWRSTIVWIETLYFTVTVYALIFALVRHLAFSIALRFNKRKLVSALNSRSLFYCTVELISILYLIPAVHNAMNLKSKFYDVEINKVCADKSVKAVLLADFHVGAGATKYELDQMVELINAENPDVIFIAGDIADSSSSVSDLEYMGKSLKALNSRYGIYYAEGNHERESRIDPEPYLESAGVIILKDEGICLKNELNIIGRRNEIKKSVPSIMRESGLDSKNPTVVIQHKPKRLHKLIGQCDLVLSGHTHGYPFPFLGLREPLVNTLCSGHRIIGDTLDAIVTTGVSQWGYRGKWPSQSEIAVININFTGVNE